jgi:hypothetical protein
LVLSGASCDNGQLGKWKLADFDSLFLTPKVGKPVFHYIKDTSVGGAYFDQN